jgi:hypothetical protein
MLGLIKLFIRPGDPRCPCFSLFLKKNRKPLPKEKFSEHFSGFCFYFLLKPLKLRSQPLFRATFQACSELSHLKTIRSTFLDEY